MYDLASDSFPRLKIRSIGNLGLRLKRRKCGEYPVVAGTDVCINQIVNVASPNVTCVFLEVSRAFQVVCDLFFHTFCDLGVDTVSFTDSLSHLALITS